MEVPRLVLGSHQRSEAMELLRVLKELFVLPCTIDLELPNPCDPSREGHDNRFEHSEAIAALAGVLALF